MSETKFVFCENCKRVFEMDAVSHINECPLCDVPNSMPEIPECVAKELARSDETIRRLKEDAERLASEYRSYDPVDEIATCVHCGKQKEFDYILAQYFYSHTADCPITLHRALMKELE